jgi:hypothetical protein
VKASSLAWVRLNSVPVIRAARPGIVRQFVAAQVVHTGKLKSLDDLEPNIITDQDGAWTLSLSPHTPSPLALDAIQQIVRDEFLGNRDALMGYLLEFRHSQINLEYCNIGA